MFRIELNRDRLSRLPISKEQSRTIDYVEMAVIDDIGDVDTIVAALANDLHHEIVYRIVQLGDLKGATA